MQDNSSQVKTTQDKTTQESTRHQKLNQANLMYNKHDKATQKKTEDKFRPLV